MTARSTGRLTRHHGDVDRLWSSPSTALKATKSTRRRSIKLRAPVPCRVRASDSKLTPNRPTIYNGRLPTDSAATDVVRWPQTSLRALTRHQSDSQVSITAIASDRTTTQHMQQPYTLFGRLWWQLLSRNRPVIGFPLFDLDVDLGSSRIHDSVTHRATLWRSVHGRADPCTVWTAPSTIAACPQLLILHVFFFSVVLVVLIDFYFSSFLFTFCAVQERFIQFRCGALRCVVRCRMAPRSAALRRIRCE